MTLKLSWHRLLAVVDIHLCIKFHPLSAAVHELAYRVNGEANKKATMLKTILSPLLQTVMIYLRSERTSYACAISLNLLSASSLLFGFLSGCQRSASLR